MSPQDKILSLVAEHGELAVEGEITRLYNVLIAHVSTDGDVRISTPCADHWLQDYQLLTTANAVAEFINFYRP